MKTLRARVWAKRRALFVQAQSAIAVLDRVHADLKRRVNAEYDLGVDEDAANLEEALNTFEEMVLLPAQKWLGAFGRIS